jgi:hypothetical protein
VSQSQTALEICTMGASSMKEGNPRWQCLVPIGNDVDDVLSFGEVAVYQALGVTSLPYPKDKDGFAEAIVAPNVGNRKAVVIGARDTRNAKVVGKMDPGDSVLHSTGPNQAAQFRAQEKKRMASVVVQDKKGKHQVIILDGENLKFQIFANGAAFQIDEDGDMSMATKGGAALLLQGNEIVLNGVVRLPGLPPGHQLVSAPLTSFAGLATAAAGPVTPVNGVGGVV